MTFGAVLHDELLWDFSFSVLGHGIITRLTSPGCAGRLVLADTAVKRLSMRETCAGIVDCIVRFEKVVRTAAFCCDLEAKFSLYFNEVHRR